MANSLGALVVTLGLDAGEYIKGLTKAEYEAQKFAKTVESTVEAARASMIALGVGAAGVAIALNDQISKIADYQDLAEKIGDTAEAVASLSTAANVSGVSLDTVSAASIKLTSSLSKTDDEAKGAGAAIAALGLNFQQFKDLSPVDQIEAVANALNSFEDGASKTAVAVALFGKAGAELLPFLNDLADGSERQVKITQEQIDAADAYDKQVKRLQGSLAGLTKQMAAESIPVMSQMVEQAQALVDYVKQSQNEYSVFEGVLAGVQVVFETIVIVASDVIFVLKGIATEFGGIGRQIAALATGDIEKFSAIGDAMKADAAKARAELDKFQADFLNRTKEIKQISEINKPKLEFSQITEKPLSQAEKDAAKEREEFIKDQRRVAIEAGDAVKKANEEYNKELDKILSGTKTGKKDQLKEDIETLNEALRIGRIDATEYAEAVQFVNEKYQKSSELANGLGLTFSSAFEDAIVSGKGFGDILKGIEQDVLRLIIRLQITKPLADSISQSLGGVSIGSLFGGGQANIGTVTAKAGSYDNPSFAGGGFTGTGSRSGGLDGQGGFMAMLHPNETVVDHAMGQGLGGGGGAVTVNVINQGSQMQVTGQSSRQNSDGSTTIDVMIAAVESGLADRMGAGVGSLFQATNSRFVPQGAM